MRPEDFKVGKWYHCSDWGTAKDFVKMKTLDIEERIIYFEEYIYDGKYSKDETYTTGEDGWFVEWDLMEEVPISKILKYLPKDHPLLSRRRNNINNING